MRTYILRRLAAGVPALLGATILVFLAVRVVPGDPVAALYKNPTPEQVEVHRRRLGLDRPLAVQYLRFLRDLARGDLGESFVTGRAVTSDIARKLPATIELTACALVLALALGIAAGVVAARKPGTVADLAVSGASVLGVSIPVFWLGLLLVLVFSVALGLFEPVGRIDPRIATGIDGPTGLYLVDTLLAGRLDAFASSLGHLILPAITLATVPGAIIARMTRASLLEALGEDYIRTARAKGLSERAVLWRHALKNALVPIATAGGVQVGYLLAGAVLTETVFAWPGLGRYVADAVREKDMPAVQGAVVLTAAIFIAVNLATDVICAVIDPRIREGAAADASRGGVSP